MLKLMELAMAAGLPFTWDAKFGYMKFANYDIHTVAGGGYEVRNKGNTLTMYATCADDVAGFIIGMGD